MTLNVMNTGDIKPENLNALIYAPSGTGKTTTARTLSGLNPIVISLEAGLLSLRNSRVDYVEVNPDQKISSLRSILEEVKKSDYDTVFIDSLSEISEAFYDLAKAEFPDSRNTMQRYGYTKELMVRFLKYTRDFKKNIIYTALQKDDKDDVGRVTHLPLLVGSIKESAPALFDFVFALRIIEKDGEQIRLFQTQPGDGFQAKDRSGALAPFEKLPTKASDLKGWYLSSSFSGDMYLSKA